MAQITAEFLGKALKDQIISFEVAPGSVPGDGHSGLLTAVTVTLKSLEVKHLLIKSFALHPTPQQLCMKSNIFYKEFKVYETLIPALIALQELSLSEDVDIAPPFAKFVYGRAINYSAIPSSEPRVCLDPLENCVIMEDLRKTGNFRLFNRFQPFDLDHCQLVVVALAKFHALSWTLKSTANVSRISEKFAFLGESFLDHVDPQMFSAMFENARALFRGAVAGSSSAVDTEKISLCSAIDAAAAKALDIMKLYYTDKVVPFSKDRVLRVPGMVKDDEQPWLVAVHLDVHVNNMLFRYDNVTEKPLEVKLVDLQGVKEGDPMADLSKFIYTSTTSSFRRRNLQALLDLYYTTFSGICTNFKVALPTGFDLPEIERRFHRTKAYGFMTCLMGLPFILNEPKDGTDINQLKEATTAKEMYKELSHATKNVKDSSIFQMRANDVVLELYSEGVI